MVFFFKPGYPGHSLIYLTRRLFTLFPAPIFALYSSVSPVAYVFPPFCRSTPTILEVFSFWQGECHPVAGNHGCTSIVFIYLVLLCTVIFQYHKTISYCMSVILIIFRRDHRFDISVICPRRYF